ncbi:alpha/beta hydrolase fold protein [Gemmatirosa kalamazoonensis]|uniref:Alpha/beta hydrolase fold protein n=1 Tax=Gemmatirosa kalamazoonensis TaxID=861299 RepID=W0RHJ4_9BACT|nr:alpha/beta hydrolase [Gemmatirosa kalamazoonensis]AHG88873.1 alpha/beta hydrolase fold protein [Gemmatirosa kalamazoonensis]
MATDVVARNNVKVFGRGTQPMLFAHGFGCDQNMWRFVTPAFENDYRIVLFDYVGSGKSDLSAYDARRYASLDGYADDVLDVVHALDLRDVIFVGHSVSAMVGVLAANREPDRFARLVLIGPSPRYIDDASADYVGGFERSDIEGLLETMDKNYIGWANFLAPAIMKNPDQPELGQELTESFCSTDPVIARRFAEATFFADNRADLARVRVPSLVLQCSDDIIAPLAVGEYLRRELPGSTVRVMHATGHCPHMSAPDETIALIEEYLAAEPAAVR